MDIRLSVTGIEKIDSFLRILPDAFNHSIMQSAHAEAARPMVTRMHLLAPVGKTGRTADSVGIIKTPFARAGVIGEVQVGPRRGRFGGSKAHFSEFGTGPRSYNGKSVGIMLREPWVEPAFEQTSDQVISKIPMILSVKLYEFVRRHNLI